MRLEHGDLLVVDRFARPENGRRAVVSVNGEYTVKSWQETSTEQGAPNVLYLVPGNTKFLTSELIFKDDIACFGVVKFIITRED